MRKKGDHGPRRSPDRPLACPLICTGGAATQMLHGGFTSLGDLWGKYGRNAGKDMEQYIELIWEWLLSVIGFTVLLSKMEM